MLKLELLISGAVGEVAGGLAFYILTKWREKEKRAILRGSQT